MNTDAETASECQGDGTKCVECGKLFSHAFYFGTHIVTHLGEKSFEPVGQCGMCGLVFLDMAIYQAHMMSLQSRLDAMAAEQQSVEESQQLEEELEPPESVAEDEPFDPHPTALPSKQGPNQVPPQQQPLQQQPIQQQQRQRLPPVSEKKRQTPPPQDGPQQETPRSDSPAMASKPEVKPPQASTPPLDAKPTSEVKPSQSDDSSCAPVKREAPEASEDAGEGLPRKRVRRAPDKYEVYHEEKKRRGPKRKALPTMPTPPGYDPEVEKYLQSLRDMGYSVAPDSVDMSQGRQGMRGRGGPPAKRGRGGTRGRGTPLGRGTPIAGSFNPALSRQVMPPPRPYTHMSMGQRGRGGVRGGGGGGGVRGRGVGAYLPPLRGTMPVNAPRPKASPHNVMIRNANQNFQPKMMEPRRDLHPNFTMDRNTSKRGFHSAAFGSHGMPPPKMNQQFYKPTPGANMNRPLGHNTTVAPAMSPAAPPKAKVAYYDVEDEIVSLINGDLEIMPISGKSTRGERLRQRQERLSHEGPDEGGKKSVKYFPRTEKTKAKKSPKKQASLKALPRTGVGAGIQGSNYALSSNSKETMLQISSVQSLQPLYSSQRARRGSRSRGRQSRSASRGHFSSGRGSRTMLAPSLFTGHANMGYPHQNPFSGRREFVTDMGTVCNVEGRMEDLREEARKNVEDMLASPAAYLEHTLGKPSTVFTSVKGNRPTLADPRLARGMLTNNPRMTRGVSRGRTRSRGRSSRGRGRATGNHRTMRGGRLRGGQIPRGLLNRRQYFPADIVVDLVEEDEKPDAASPRVGIPETAQEHSSASDNLDGCRQSDSPEGTADGQNEGGGDVDKEEIVEGADIDGWTVSISKMSDSDGEENETKDGKEEEEETASTEGVHASDQSTSKDENSKDESTAFNNDNAMSGSKTSEAVTMSSAVEKTEVPNDHPDSVGKPSLDMTATDELRKDELNDPKHENMKHQPHSEDSEVEEKISNSCPENTNQDSVFETPKGENLKTLEDLKEKDDCFDSMDQACSEIGPAMTVTSMNVHQSHNNPVPEKITGSSESPENMEQSPDIVASMSSMAPSPSNTHGNVQSMSCDGGALSETHHDEEELNQARDNNSSQQLESISQGGTHSGKDFIANENNQGVLEGAEFAKEPESCDISESKNVLGGIGFSPLTKADFNAEGGSEVEAHSRYLLDDSSDFMSSSLGASKEGTPPPSTCLKDSKADSSSAFTTALPSALASDLSSATELSSVHGDKVAEEGQNHSQRLDSDNGYDDADNFSEIEKTCQEIIRDVENQEEERRASLEN